jgi:hypothetical protein
MATMRRRVLTEQEKKMQTLFAEAKKVELTKVQEILAYVRSCLGAAQAALTSGDVEDNPEPDLDVQGIVDDLEHTSAKLSREIRKLDRVVQIAIDNEVDATYYHVHDHSPTR